MALRARQAWRTTRRAAADGRRRRAEGRTRTAARSTTVVPWYLIVLGVAIAASTNAAQQRAVTVLSDTSGDLTDPLPDVAPAWMKESRRARTAWTLVSRVINRMGQDNLTLVAAGVAFYAMFSIFPALGTLVSIYAFFGDTHVVQAQVQQLTALLPGETADLLNASLNALINKPNASLSTGLLISLGVALWAARAGTYSMMTGLNVAFERREQRSLIAQNAIAIGLTFGAILFAMVALTIVAVIPIVLAVLPFDETMISWLAYLRWPVLVVFIVISIDVIYRFGPSRDHPQWSLMSAGTLFAASLWIVGSWAFSFYVTRFGSYDKMYGSLGAVIVLLLWFWISALAVLMGATIDAVRADMKKRQPVASLAAVSSGSWPR